ncbi:heme NO-binding domain-containing protein [Maritalea mobilis]|uniref:heme NO-binding domain-containing protein n=1 Tax=Maritalea mobilis TaxID=483324 RepID=UPI001C97085E|nr:heme NO-binding domain-containing protein [Maritalea mobilis]MBY6202547.1 heme NO-binding domain-containing protein [Maritalea mobilis]
MHGMINRALQGFLVAHYGERSWDEIRSIAGIPPEGFEAMLQYDEAQTLACFEAAVTVLHKHPNALLEDIGTYLVTNPALEPLRRLLRFGGPTFLDFLLSLEDLRDRGRLAIPDLDLPRIRVEELDPSSYRIRAQWSLPGIAPILLGGLRAMADDYGALALLRLDGMQPGEECLHVQLLDMTFAEGRQFVLGGVGA